MIILESGLFECLQSPVLSLTVSSGVQAWTLGAQWRRLPYYLPFTLMCPLIHTFRLIFSLFFPWVIEIPDFSVACGIRVFSILTPMMFQQCTTAFSEIEAWEEERFKPADFVGLLKPSPKFSIFSPSLTQVWKQHLSRNGNMPWEFLLWKS